MSDAAGVVVVGVDGSKNGAKAIEWADSYAKSTGASVRLVGAWTWPVNYGVPIAYDGFDPAALTEEILGKAKAELTLPDDRVESVCVQGNAGPTLVAQSEGASLLVVGSRGHGEIATILLGSVSGYCVHHASCPVVVVR